MGTAAESGPLAVVQGELRIAVRVVPRAGANALAGCRRDADGAATLLVRVTAAPEKGRANAAVRRLLAKALGVAPGALDLKSGETDRTKLWVVRPGPDLSLAEAARRLGLPCPGPVSD